MDMDVGAARAVGRSLVRVLAGKNRRRAAASGAWRKKNLERRIIFSLAAEPQFYFCYD